MKNLFLFFCILFCSIQITAQTPVAYYPFTGNANDAMGTLHGAVNGAALTTDRFGNANSAYSFDGVDDFISINHSAVFNFTSYTISLWFKYNNTGTAGKAYWTLISKNSTGTGFEDPFHIWVTDLSFTTGGRTGDGIIEVYAGNPPAVNDGQWHQVSLVCDNANNLFIEYLDDILLSSTPFTVNPFLNGSSINIGRWEAYSNYFNGSIDEVKLFNTAFTAAQVQQEYNSSRTGLVAYYPFTGNANDAIGTLNGTVNGATLTTDRFGHANHAYSFDGVNDAISFATIPMNNIDNFTLMAWVDPAVFDPANQFNKMIISLGPGSNGYNIGMGNGSGSGGGNQLSSLYNSVAWINSGSFFSTINTWYHIVMVRDNGLTKFYLNGVQAPNTSGAAPNAFTSDFQIGGQSFDPSHFWNGKIDEVKIYNRALTTLQVQQEYASGSQLQEPGSGNALSFNGVDNFVSAPHNEQINFGVNQNFTVETWVKIPLALAPNETTTTVKTPVIIEKWDGDGSSYPFVIRYTNHNIANPLSVRGTIVCGRYDGTNNPLVNSLITLNDDKFHHIAFVKNGPNLELFVDGILRNSTVDNTTASTKNTNGLIIGNGSLSGTPRPFFGSIDETRIWDIALTQSQIRDRMCKKISSSDPLYPNLAAYYNFDESISNTAFDGTVNANNGILTNSPTRVTSGAAIGDNSAHNYVTSGLPAGNISFSNQDNLAVMYTAGTFTGEAGTQVYVINEEPNTENGIAGVGVNNRYFGVFNCNLTGPEYTATYNYTGNPFVNGGNENALVLFKRTDNAATIWTNSAALLNTVAKTLTATGQNTEYMLGSTGIVLPLQLLSFNGIKKNGQVLLNWKTGNEINTSHFEILRSQNGIDFLSLGNVSAAGSTGSNNYSFNDYHPFSALNYYRLRQIDLDGRATLSNIVRIRMDETVETLLLWPNPVTDILNMAYNGASHVVNIRVFDSRGVLLQAQNMQSSSNMQLDVRPLARGMYWIEMNDGENTRRSSFVKQ